MNEITLNWNEYTESAIKTAAEGIVMIENRDKVLPLKTGAHVALFGRMQTHYYKSGTGSGGMVNVHHVTDIREGLNDCSGITLDAELMDIYDKWDAENPIDTGLGWGKEAWSQAEMPVSSELAETLASRNDYAVVIIARTAGEDRDNSAEKGAYYLSDSEEELLKNVTAAFTNVIVLLNVGNIIDMSFVKKYNVKGVLYVWQAGMIGGISVARVLSGRENPSGCLPDTIAEKLEDYASDANFLKDPKEDVYREDIFVGYSSETEEDHQQSLSLMREVGYDSAFMFKYSERPGTYASKHLPDDVPEEVKIRRLNEIIALQNELSAEANRKCIGKQYDVLLEGISKRSKDELFGRTGQNKVVIVPRGDLRIGQTVPVVITDSSSATLKGNVIYNKV